MLRKGPQSSSRKVVWVEGQSVKGWGCSECAWVFHPSGPPTGESLDEMKRNFQARCDQEFTLHVCDAHRGAKMANS
jgi:rubredoxin